MKLIRIIFYAAAFIAIAIIAAGIISPTQTYVITKEVKAPLDHSFEVFMDSSSFPHWIKNYRGVKTIYGEPDIPGHIAQLTIKEAGKVIVLKQELLGFEENKSYDFKLENDAIAILVNIDFKATDTGCIIRSESIVEGNGILWKGLLSLYRTLISVGMEKQYSRLVSYIESTYSQK